MRQRRIAVHSRAAEPPRKIRDSRRDLIDRFDPSGRLKEQDVESGLVHRPREVHQTEGFALYEIGEMDPEDRLRPEDARLLQNIEHLQRIPQDTVDFEDAEDPIDEILCDGRDRLQIREVVALIITEGDEGTNPTTVDLREVRGDPRGVQCELWIILSIGEAADLGQEPRVTSRA